MSDEAIVIAVYFLPTVVAMARRVRWGGLFLLNLFAGWTILGWFVCLYWACKYRPVGKGGGHGPVVTVEVRQRRHRAGVLNSDAPPTRLLGPRLPTLGRGAWRARSGVPHA